MLIYKGFIKIAKYGEFYPISKITKLIPMCCSPLKTRIYFDNGSFITVDYPMIKLIDMLNGTKE